MLPKAHDIPRVEVQTEEERPGGWSYLVIIHRTEGAQEHTVTLSWRDHDYWCGGASAPSRVVQAVIEYVLRNDAPAPLPLKFDAAKARRWLPRIDQELRAAI
ncbi:MAG TPA: hypothetical protein VD997_00840 [Phycisphaerales bacterium]|nr:hypothetical protein [Phycisphaerales bacterium]